MGEVRRDLHVLVHRVACIEGVLTGPWRPPANGTPVAVIFLYLVCESPAGNGFDRWQRRLILSAYKKLRAPAATVGAVRHVWQDWNPIGADG